MLFIAIACVAFIFTYTLMIYFMKQKENEDVIFSGVIVPGIVIVIIGAILGIQGCQYNSKIEEIKKLGITIACKRIELSQAEKLHNTQRIKSLSEAKLWKSLHEEVRAKTERLAKEKSKKEELISRQNYSEKNLEEMNASLNSLKTKLDGTKIKSIAEANAISNNIREIKQLMEKIELANKNKEKISADISEISEVICSGQKALEKAINAITAEVPNPSEINAYFIEEENLRKMQVEIGEMEKEHDFRVASTSSQNVILNAMAFFDGQWKNLTYINPQPGYKETKKEKQSESPPAPTTRLAPSARPSSQPASAPLKIPLEVERPAKKI